MIAELVPPKPKESTVDRRISRCSANILILDENSSGLEKFMFGAIKLFSIMIRLYTNSLAPAIQHSWPLIDLVEETGGQLSPNTLKSALASEASPNGVEVA